MLNIDFNRNWTYCREGEEVQIPVTLPHDAMLHEARQADAESGSAGAYFPGGIYLYRKEFDVPAEWAGRQVLVRFEGVYRNATVTLNGAGNWQIVNGYTERSFDVADALRYGEKNEILVRVDNSKQPNSRWYSGSGIYRPVSLLVLPAVRIEEEGVRVRTLSIAPAEIEVTTAHNGGRVKVEILERGCVADGTAEGACGCVMEGAGNCVTDGIAEGVGTCVADGAGDCVRLAIPDAKLWSAEHPELYTARVTLFDGDMIADTREVTFGIRQISWSPKGFFVNGEETLLRGGCLHHDNGVLGACAYSEAEDRKVRIMKELGFNAIRSAHNPCSRALLDACDRYGMYMMDETWDMWYRHKSKYDYADRIREFWQDDIRALVRKDFNHPSVIMYSIGNEISEPAKEEGLHFAQGLIDLFHGLDPDRPVTAGLNLMIVANAAKGKEMYNADGGINMDTAAGIGGSEEAEEKVESAGVADGQTEAAQKAAGGAASETEAAQEAAAPQMPDFSKMDSTMFNMIAMQMGSGMNHSADGDDADLATTPILDALDLAGDNYASGRYPMEGEKHPERVIFGSETLPPDLADNWAMVKKFPYLVGDFMWTAFDYLGEAGIGAWSYSPDGMQFDKPYPWLIGGAGVIDILGNPDAEALWAGMVWGTDTGVKMAVTPANHPGVEPYHSAWRGTNAVRSWSWRGCEGNPVKVEAYSDGAEVALFLDGEEIGRRPVEKYRAVFETLYRPGRLEVVAYDADGRETGRDVLVSAGEELQIRLTPEFPSEGIQAGPATGREQSAAPYGKVEPGQVVFISVSLADANGNVESNADELLTAEVTGGELLGFGSASPCTVDSFVTGRYAAYYGRALAVVRAVDGDLRLKVSSESGLEAELNLGLASGYAAHHFSV